MRVHRIGVVVTVGAVLSLGQGEGTTLYVRQGNAGTPPYDTPETAAGSIQLAVDVANYGDVVSIGPGDYDEKVSLREGVILWGAGPSAATTRSVAGAAYAEIRGMGIVLPGGAERPLARENGIALGPHSGQLVSDCTISGPFDRAILCRGPVYGVPVVIRRCVVEGAFVGVGMDGSWGNVMIDDCVLRDNQSAGLEAYFGDFGTLTVTRCVISGNASWGIALVGPGQRAWVDGCTFANNTYTAIYPDCGAELEVSNSVIFGSDLGITCGEEALVDIINCTIADNRYGIYDWGSVRHRILNSIVWGGDKAVVAYSNPPQVSFSDVQRGFELTIEDDGEVYYVDPGHGNIDADPLFVAPPAGDFRLRPGSPCIDIGSFWGDPPSAHGGSWQAADRAGKARRLYGGKAYEVDMGAYEFTINRLAPIPGTHEAVFTWSSLPDRIYSIFYTEDLMTWILAADSVPSAGNETTSWTDDGSLTGVAPSLVPRRFYRILENP